MKIIKQTDRTLIIRYSFRWINVVFGLLSLAIGAGAALVTRYISVLAHDGINRTPLIIGLLVLGLVLLIIDGSRQLVIDRMTKKAKVAVRMLRVGGYFTRKQMSITDMDHVEYLFNENRAPVGIRAGFYPPKARISIVDNHGNSLVFGGMSNIKADKLSSLDPKSSPELAVAELVAQFLGKSLKAQAVVQSISGATKQHVDISR